MESRDDSNESLLSDGCVPRNWPSWERLQVQIELLVFDRAKSSATMAVRSQEPDPPREASTTNGEDPAQTPQKPKHQLPKSQVGKLWDEFGNPEEPVNLMPGGTYNSAGGKPKEPTMSDAVKSVSLKDVTSFYKAPCARDSLLVGIGTGFGVGGVRAVLGGKQFPCPFIKKSFY